MAARAISAARRSIPARPSTGGPPTRAAVLPKTASKKKAKSGSADPADVVALAGKFGNTATKQLVAHRFAKKSAAATTATSKDGVATDVVDGEPLTGGLSAKMEKKNKKMLK